MDKLAPKLIRRAVKQEYTAIIIDPIYKVITGDENSAEQMAHFCNQFDRIATELNCSVIYCHHHSKGAQGGKRAIDRASGSGVFGRDADALLDMIELDAEQVGSSRSAWRIEGTLREYASFRPVNVWFDYPVHRIDDTGTLESIKLDVEMKLNEKGQRTRQKQRQSRIQNLEAAYNACLISGEVTIDDMAEYLDISPKTLRRDINSSEEFTVKNGKVERNIDE